MLSSLWLLFSFLPMFTTLISGANDQLIPRNHACSQILGNFSDSSDYTNNRQTVLKEIYSNTEIDYGFYNASLGDNPYQVNGIGICRGDVEPEACRSCLERSAAFLSERCSQSYEAILYYDVCTLRYSNKSIFGVMETATNNYYVIANKTAVDDAFNQTLNDLLDGLKSTAAEGDSRKKFAENNATVIDESNDTKYGLVQCTPDLSKQNCIDCLDLAFGDIQSWCKDMKGCLFLGPSCSFRYDIFKFFNSIVNNTESPTLPPQPLEALPPPTNSTNPPPAPEKSWKLVTVVVVAVVVVGILLVGICIYLRRRTPRPVNTAEFEDQEINEDEVDVEEEEAEVGNDLKDGGLLQFDFATIELATSNFSDTNKLGQGGFGSVYKGMLPDGQDIAIKRLAKNSEQGETEFKNEVLLTGKLQHRNLVKLLGFCLQKKERLLVYEFVTNRSLDYIIFDPIKRANLNWERRYKIIKDIARGLVYLHEDSRLQIVHRDLKTSNILLDDEMNPKITDFGIAKLFDANQSYGMTKTVVGTPGYMAPEYIKHGEFSVKSDVFSYGVIILEIVCGRGIIKNDLLSIAWKNWKAGTSSDIVDPLLDDQGFNKNEKLRCIHVGLLCVQEDIDVRPTMSSVLQMLSSTIYQLSEPSEPPFLEQPKRALSIHLSEQYSGPTKSSDSGSGSQPTQGSTSKSSATDQ